MKRATFWIVAFVAMTLASCTDKHTGRVAVIPQPLKTEVNAGYFTLGSDTKAVIAADDEDKLRLENMLAERLGIESGETGSVVLRIDNSSDEAESYRLHIDKKGIEITAPAAAGLFYGVQTLAQLGDNGRFPCCTIEDKPRFAYRGIMLDVSRHWFGKEHVLKQIDILSQYKFNHLHLHLTDAAGWRIEIEKYPLLTELAAWRSHSSWKDWWTSGREYVKEGSEGACGGYFTKDDIREIVAYAADRYITVIPEIEMPSHSEEVMAAYPDLSCSKGKSIQGDLCIGNEATFTFLEDVLTEVMDMFPSKYIHIGGDEAAMNHWKNCPLCQKRMKDENLQSVQELQGYMIRRIEKFLQAHGREIIGWDEIVDGGTSPDATIMCWRGIERGVAAAGQGHDVIMTPGGYCYFDSYQDAPYSQPEAIGGYTPIEKVYSYDPAPDSLSVAVAERIRGVQANLWAEYIPTREHAEFMLYPRVLALSEVAWSRPSVKDFYNFREIALINIERLKQQGVNVFDLANEIGNRPEAQEPCEHLALGKSVVYAEGAEYYPGYAAGGDNALTDGICGGWSYGDKHWQGFVDKAGVDVTIDLGGHTDIHYIGADFMQICAPDVWMPAEVEIYVSEDGENFSLLAHIDHEVVRDDVVSFKNFAWEGDTGGRYVRYRARHGKFGGFLFVDEIVVR